jgi:heterodisulfide reductase subunit A
MNTNQKVVEPQKEIRIGVYICQCGSNIAGTVDTEAVRVFAETLPNVVLARSPKYTCSDAGQAEVINDIQEQGLNRVVVAACSPRMHEPTFRRTLEVAGLNPYYLEMANIREHASWVHEPGEALNRKAQDLVSAAVRRVAGHQELFARQSPVTPAVLVVGGGIAGIQAALDVADAGYKAYLVERDPSIGGHMAQLDKTFPTLDCST